MFQARLMVKEKNADELFQEFVFHTSDASVKPRTADAPLSKDEMKQHRDEGQSPHFLPLLSPC